MPVSTIIRLSPEDVQAVMSCDWETAVKWADPLSGAAVLHHISTPKRMAPWLATIAHESAGLTRLQEYMFYSAQRLTEVWPSRFGPGRANPVEYASNPEKLANFVYSNRMGNGDEASGDGWKYIGRGPIQLTGRENYTRCMAAIGTNIVDFPDLLIEPSVGALAAGWYWEDRGVPALELHLDLVPGGFDLVPQADELVVGDHEPGDDRATPRQTPRRTSSPGSAPTTTSNSAAPANTASASCALSKTPSIPVSTCSPMAPSSPRPTPPIPQTTVAAPSSACDSR